jgi:hypothetical protein
MTSTLANSKDRNTASAVSDRYSVADEIRLKRGKKMDTKSLPDLLNELGVTSKIVAIDHPESAPEWAKNKGHAYRVTVKRNGKRVGFYYYTGFGVKESSTADVVWALARDYDSSCYTLEEFGTEYGWDKDTLSTYKAVKRNWAKFTRLFPESEIRQAVAEMEY